MIIVYGAKSRKKSNQYCSVPKCVVRNSENILLHYFPNNEKLCIDGS